MENKLLVLGSLALGWRQNRVQLKFMKASWFFLSALSLFLFSSMATLITYVIRRGYPTYFVLLGLSVVLVAFYSIQMAVYRPQRLHFDMRLWLVLLLIGVLSALGNLALYKATSIAPNPGLAVAVNGLQAGVVALLSVRFLGSSLNKVQVIGLILGLAAIVTLGLGSRMRAPKTVAGTDTRAVTQSDAK